MKQKLVSTYSSISSGSGSVHAGISVQGMPRMFSIKDIRVLVGGKSRSTIYRWIADGNFPAPIKVCGSSMWPEEVIAVWRNQIINQ
jgi:predicted DNA-binding transcriptional regulator AlpA